MGRQLCHDVTIKFVLRTDPTHTSIYGVDCIDNDIDVVFSFGYDSRYKPINSIVYNNAVWDDVDEIFRI